MAPLHNGLLLIASFLNTRFAIDLPSVVRLIVSFCETGHWSLTRFPFVNNDYYVIIWCGRYYRNFQLGLFSMEGDSLRKFDKYLKDALYYKRKQVQRGVFKRNMVYVTWNDNLWLQHVIKLWNSLQ